MRLVRSGVVVGALVWLAVAAAAHAGESGGVIGFEGGPLQQIEASDFKFSPGWHVAFQLGYRGENGVELHMAPGFQSFGSNDKEFNRTAPTFGLGLRWYMLPDGPVTPWVGASAGIGAILTRYNFSRDLEEKPSSNLPVVTGGLQGGVAFILSPNFSLGMFLGSNAYIPTGNEAGGERTVIAAELGLQMTFTGLSGIDFLRGFFGFFEGILRFR
jgi:hypothetical protein